jgi:hypothetical protein
MAESFPERLARIAAERDKALRELRKERAAHKKDLSEFEDRMDALEAASRRPKVPFIPTGFRTDCPCLTPGAIDHTFTLHNHARCFHCVQSFDDADEMKSHVATAHHGEGMNQ